MIEVDEEGKEVMKHEKKVFERQRVDSTLHLEEHPMYAKFSDKQRSETQKNLNSMYAISEKQ